MAVNREYRIVRVELKDLRALMAGYLPMVRPIGGYFWQTRQELHPDEELLVELYVRSLGRLFSFDCRVSGSLRSAGFDTESGYVLAFKPTEEQTVQEMLNTVGWNLIGSNRRLHPRFPITVPIAWKREDREDLFLGQTANISIGGAFIQTDEPNLPSTESLVTIHIRDDGSEMPLSMVARVAWLRKNLKRPGMGIQFLYQDSDMWRRFHRMMEQHIPRDITE